MATGITEAVQKAATGPEILIVDDDRSSCEILSKILSLRGYRVDIANDGATALELVQSKTYGLALIDYRMPGMDGVRFLEASRKVTPDSVRILFTGQADLQAVSDAVNRGSVFRVLLKPCPPISSARRWRPAWSSIASSSPSARSSSRPCAARCRCWPTSSPR